MTTTEHTDQGTADGERWRAVVGFDGLYEVSDHGHVRSLDRTDAAGRRRKGRPLQPSQDGEGYLRIGLTPAAVGGVPARARFERVHVLVLTAFVGPRPDGMEGCHDNDVPDDNRLTNLRWDTPAANRADAVRLRTGLTGVGRRRRRDGQAPAYPRRNCTRGHALIEPNLTRPADGRRRCLACKRGAYSVHNAARRGRTLDVRTEADRHYADIMKATPDTTTMITTDEQTTTTQDQEPQASERLVPRHRDPEVRRVRAAKINNPAPTATPARGARPC